MKQRQLDAKVLAAILTGINRAFPFVKGVCVCVCVYVCVCACACVSICAGIYAVCCAHAKGVCIPLYV